LFSSGRLISISVHFQCQNVIILFPILIVSYANNSDNFSSVTQKLYFYSTFRLLDLQTSRSSTRSNGLFISVFYKRNWKPRWVANWKLLRGQFWCLSPHVGYTLHGFG